MPTCDIAIIIVCAGRHGTTERRAGAPGMNTKYEPDEIILLCNYLHCYSGHGGTWAAAVADSIKKVYSSIGYCYRIAGDEFCVILKRGKMDVLSNSEEEYFIPEKDELMYQKKWLRKQGKR